MTDIERDAKNMLETAKKERQAMSKTAEPKGAAPASPAEKIKTEGETEEQKKAREDVEAKAAKDKETKEAEAKLKEEEALIARKDDELNEDDKKRKAEVIKVKAETDKKTGFQKRVDELHGQVLALENNNQSTKAERDAVKAELDAVKKRLNMTPQDDIREKSKIEVAKRQSKYIEEDKGLPREDRREMTKEEYDEWKDEDPDAAQEWRERRVYRRVEEEKEVRTDLEQTIKAEVILNQQQQSAKRTYIKHPELSAIESRRSELIKQGKTREETQNILCKEIPKFKVISDIYSENPTKYMLSENGPELMVEEMEKRLDRKADNPDIEELKKRIVALEEDNARLQGLDVEVSSTRHVEPKPSQPEIVKKTVELGMEMGLTKEQAEKAVERRKSVR